MMKLFALICLLATMTLAFASKDETNASDQLISQDRKLPYCTRWICGQAYVIIKGNGCLDYCGYRRTEEVVDDEQNNQVATTESNDRKLPYCTRWICGQAYVIIKGNGCLDYCGYRRTEEVADDEQNNQVATSSTESQDRKLPYCTRWICGQAYVIIKGNGCLDYCGYRRTEEVADDEQNNQVATSSTESNDRKLPYCTRWICGQAYVIIKGNGCLDYCGYRRTEEVADDEKNNQVATSSTESQDRKLPYCTRWICGQAYVIIKGNGCLDYCGYRRTEEEETSEEVKNSNLRRRILSEIDN